MIIDRMQHQVGEGELENMFPGLVRSWCSALSLNPDITDPNVCTELLSSSPLNCSMLLTPFVRLS